MRTYLPLIGLILINLTACNLNKDNRSHLNHLKDEAFEPPLNNERMRLFDADWRFSKDDFIGAEQPGFDDSKWRKTDLPHDWSIEDLPGQKDGEVIGPFFKKSIGVFYTGYTEGGIAWYRKKFLVSDTDKEKEFSICFDGVYMTANVWINGHLLGSHKHGYTPFCYRLNDFLNSPGQDNTLAVLVKNTGENSRWYSGSGIYRHVWLMVTDKINLPQWSVYITTPHVSENESDVIIKTVIFNGYDKDSALSVRNTILSRDGKKVAAFDTTLKLLAGERKDIQSGLKIGESHLWSTDSPYLYTLRTELISRDKVVDATETAFGIRSTVFSPDRGFLLNGKRVILKGACIHHDNGSLGSAAIDRAEQRKIRILKDNGFNAIRTSHNPPSQGFLDACDRLGMLVLDEAFDMWEQPKRPDDYSLYFSKYHKQDLQSMISRDRNHPSIIMWSIGNEIRERADSSGLKIGMELKRIIRELDSTRAVTMAICEFWETKGRPWEQSAPAFAQLELCGYNYVWREYEKDHLKYPSRVMAGTESFALDIYENWKMATDKPYVTGDFVWTGMDYLGEAGIGQAMTDSVTMCWPWIISNCGDLDIMGFKKPQSYYRDVVWGRSKLEMAVEELPPAGKKWIIRAWGWPRESKSWTWPGKEGKLMNVNVYSGSDSVRLFLNDSLVGEQSGAQAEKLTHRFNVAYKPGKLRAVAISNGKTIDSRELVTAGVPAALTINPDRSEITTDRNDLLYVTIEMHDASGVRIPYAADVIKFHVDGPAQLETVDNGNPREPKSFRTNWCRLYQGRCIAIIRPIGKAGKACITAISEGFTPTHCSVDIK